MIPIPRDALPFDHCPWCGQLMGESTCCERLASWWKKVEAEDGRSILEDKRNQPRRKVAHEKEARVDD